MSGERDEEKKNAEKGPHLSHLSHRLDRNKPGRLPRRIKGDEKIGTKDERKEDPYVAPIHARIDVGTDEEIGEGREKGSQIDAGVTEVKGRQEAEGDSQAGPDQA